MLDVVNPGPIPVSREVPQAHFVAAVVEANVSLSELARRLNCAFSTVSRWQNGHASISRGRWLEILEALGLPADWRPPAPKQADPPDGGDDLDS